MIKLDRNYSDYTVVDNPKYPAGAAMDSSASNTPDGTPFLARLLNDLMGWRQALHKKAFGDATTVSGQADDVDTSDTLNGIVKLYSDADKAHANLRGTAAHGGTVAPNASTVVVRDELGRIKASAPAANDDVVRKAELDALVIKGSAPVVGHVYIQFRGQSAPADLYPGTTWSNISSTYAGRFFRAEGGSAAAFGRTQAGGLPNITGMLSIAEGAIWDDQSSYGAFYAFGGSAAEDPNIGNWGYKNAYFSAKESNSLYGAASEVRPVNETFRIWKRTA